MLIDVFLTIKTLFDGSCAIPNLSTVYRFESVLFFTEAATVGCLVWQIQN